MYNINLKRNKIPVQISLPLTTHTKIIKLAKDIDCISETENPKAASAVAKTMRVVLNFYSDEQFQECLEDEGIDALAFKQKCIRQEMKENLKKKNR